MLSVFSRIAVPKASSMFALTALKYPTRRTLITTVIRLQPAAGATKAKTAKTTATKKAPAKSTATKSKAKTATKAAKTTKAAAPKKKKVVAKKPKVEKPPRLTKEDLPPKGPGSPYLYFFKKYLAGVQGPLNRETIPGHAKAAGPMWRAMTEQEKQPFYEEQRVAAEKQGKARAEWKENADPAIVRRINQRRTKLGKPKVRGASHRSPNAYSLFFADRFAGIRERLSKPGMHPREVITAVGKELGSVWKSLPDAEKQVYVKQAAERKAAMA
ncbi:hypothetical protein OE88DRAFT_1811126 [Heliocybe sulcata]|uniref:HMG box domain-containing protein n=1 Tax=Heliocybe sulcata TaxID=5364 RepID=A0A5C3MS95_9AGAM|nr:hypothetical protein OE88DRAFT_1811126 [Heliocybe sulcata]